jgi:hypothetical protein
VEILLALALGLVIGFLLGAHVAGTLVGHRLHRAMRDGDIDRATAVKLSDLRRER